MYLIHTQNCNVEIAKIHFFLFFLNKSSLFHTKEVFIYRKRKLTMKFETELESINFFCNQLIQSGFTEVDCTQVTDKYCYYDIQAEYNNKKCRFELKRRDCESYTYNDSVIEYFKYKEFLEDITNGQIYKAFVVSFFNDIYTLDDVCSEHTISVKQAPATTEFENTNKKNKWFVHYQQEKKFQY